MLTDTHCHLGQFNDPGAVLRDAALRRVRIVVATESPEEYRRLLSRVRGYSYVTVGLGMHPASRAARDPGQLSRFFRFLPEARWVSEVGLDFGRSTDRIDRRSQVAMFESILSHAVIRSKVLSVHSRGAAGEVIPRLREAQVAAVLHWFSGSVGELELAVEAGLYFSLNEPMLRSQKASTLVARIPRERILLETDGPYAKGGEGEALTPTTLVSLTKRLGGLLDLSTDEVVMLADENYDRLLSAASV